MRAGLVETTWPCWLSVTCTWSACDWVPAPAVGESCQALLGRVELRGRRQVVAPVNGGLDGEDVRGVAQVRLQPRGVIFESGVNMFGKAAS